MWTVFAARTCLLPRIHPLIRFVRCCWLLLLLAGLSFGARAAEDPWAAFDMPWFDRVGVSDGLPHSLTTALAQDQRGLVWIGTQSGLVRYDGFRMQVFTATGGPKADLPDAYVRALLALPDGGMLIATNSGGLSRFNPLHNAFHTYPVGKDGTSSRKIYALARDGNDGVWIAGEHGLDRLDLHTNQIVVVPTGAGTSPRNFSVLQDRAGNLWLGNNNGLFVRHQGDHAFERAPRPADRGTVDAVLNDGIWALDEDRAGRLWVGSTQAGAVYRDANEHWHAVEGFSGFQRNHERRATVRDFVEVDPDTLWLATDGDGVLAYKPSDGTLRAITHDTAMPSSLPGDAVRALMRDRSGNIWVATDLGVARNNVEARKAFALLPSSHDARALASSNVRTIFVDSHRRIWLGMNAGNIELIDLDHGVIHHLQLGGDQARRDVQAFAETHDGTIWVGTQGLARIDPATLDIQNSVIPMLEASPVLHLLPDGDRLLIATYDGVYRYDLHTRALTHFGNNPSDPRSLASDTVRLISRVGSQIWYVTGRGISVAANGSQDRNFENLLNRPDDPTSLPNNLASSITTDPQGNLWIGTYGGLAMLESRAAGEPYRFKRFDTRDGLSSDNINAALSDDLGNLWVSLPNGISMMDGNTHAMHNLGARDGLHIASYVYAAAARAPDGELLFGGLGGLTVLRPGWQPPESTDAPLAVTLAAINGNPLPFGQLPRPGESLHLGSHSRSLRVDFALLDFQATADTSYSYRLDGMDEDWVHVPRGSQPAAIYTNLPHGDYLLRLRAQTQGMQPRTIESSLSVTVAPRWYETIAALVGFGVLLLALLYLVTQLRTLYLRRQAQQLQQQVDLRTHDLLIANQRLDELASTDPLTGALNRRRFFELAEQVRLESREGEACIALLDLDGFKVINDTHGHLTGDAVIRHVCQTMRQQCRGIDLIGRYGGEELVICLPGTGLGPSMAIAECIRGAIAGTPFEHDGATVAVTISIGVAAYQEGESLSQWLSRADGALYEAKRNGRNRAKAAE
ncbi:ligand-binding sensor domain-containing diguanylate cyclase [Dyella amyloliquefaciens]|uniref:ligand-binding sensor domain-containing diguanylate cyclase n=1 Tax=Dyella amyloliquefaciens TaxID=1770545 RepID=UPI00102EC1C3|nr:ligand-binding sensor domain-containing diguanylate cyclase [Dyella amyloliquefaciens]